MRSILFATTCLLSSTAWAVDTDYRQDVLPIMKERCWDCHSNETEVKGNLALDDLDEVRLYQIGPYNLIRPGNPEESNFVERLKLPPSHNDFMPRKADALPEEELAVIEKWIQAGAVIDRDNLSDGEKERLGMSGGDALDPEAYHGWTSSDGKTIEARFLGYNNGTVSLLLKSNGERFDVPEDRFSEESVQLARELAEAARR